jgi:hypothetical protein
MKDIQQMFAIEKNIPLPPSKRAKSEETATLTKTLRSMEIGDSIYVAMSQSITTSKLKTARYSVKLATRKEGNGTRVWRTA